MNPSPLCPPFLKRGSTLAVVAPAGQLPDPLLFKEGVAILEAMGFHLRYPEQLWPGPGFLADSDVNRARELERAFADPDIDGLIAARGGYGCLRLLPFLDFPALCKHPKLLLGFSDLTILQNVLWQKTGLISLHGPVVTSLPMLTRDSHEMLYQSLLGNWQGVLRGVRPEVLRNSSPVSGRLIGGNLSSLVTLLGTCYDLDWQDAIVLLEDVNEPLYRVDRLLTQLQLAGKLQQASGLLLGDFRCGGSGAKNVRLREQEWVWRRVLELTAQQGIPVFAGLPCGHGEENMPLPLGARVAMDPGRGTLRIVS